MSKREQSLSFAQLSDRALDGSPYAVNATATSGLAVSFIATTPEVCTVSGNLVTLIALGSCTVAALQLGNNTYNPAPPATNTFQVQPPAPQNPSVVFLPIVNR